jgi:hypothetical protein
MEVGDLISVGHPGGARAAAGEDVNKVPRVPETGRKTEPPESEDSSGSAPFYTPSLGPARLRLG